MDVRVCGPNLNDQSKGQFHVHADGCADLRKYGPQYRGRDAKGGDLNGNREMLVTDATVVRVVESVYDNGIIDEAVADGETREQVIDRLISDFWFAPAARTSRKTRDKVRTKHSYMSAGSLTYRVRSTSSRSWSTFVVGCLRS